MIYLNIAITKSKDKTNKIPINQFLQMTLSTIDSILKERLRLNLELKNKTYSEIGDVENIDCDFQNQEDSSCSHNSKGMFQVNLKWDIDLKRQKKEEDEDGEYNDHDQLNDKDSGDQSSSKNVTKHHRTHSSRSKSRKYKGKKRQRKANDRNIMNGVNGSNHSKPVNGKFLFIISIETQHSPPINELSKLIRQNIQNATHITNGPAMQNTPPFKINPGLFPHMGSQSGVQVPPMLNTNNLNNLSNQPHNQTNLNNANNLNTLNNAFRPTNQMQACLFDIIKRNIAKNLANSTQNIQRNTVQPHISPPQMMNFMQFHRNKLAELEMKKSQCLQSAISNMYSLTLLYQRLNQTR